MNIRLLDASRRPAVRVAFAIAVLLGAIGCSDTDEGSGSTGPDDSVPISGGSGTTSSLDAGSEGTAAAEATSLDGIEVQLTPVASLDSPIAMATREGTDDLYVAERAGRVQVLTSDGDDGFEVGDEALIDISDNVSTESELGLLGLTFSPDGSRLYLSHSDADGNTRLVEYAMDGDAVDESTERELFYLEDEFGNHNGGQITFGPDGYLYYALGDGGGAGDPLQSAQDPTQLFGKILRIDPFGATDGEAYSVPADNPFADGVDGRPEIYLYGVRNPWRFSFDRETADLWIGDVGQGEWEEVDLLPAAGGAGAGLGANLGWSEVEGTHPYEGGTEPEGAIAPIFEYSHEDGGCSVTGGYVYRGSAIPDLQGTYVFGDYCAGELRGLVEQDGEVLAEGPLGPTVTEGSLVSFGQDDDGELYVISNTAGLLRIDPA